MGKRIKIRHRQEPWRPEFVSETVFDPRRHVPWGDGDDLRNQAGEEIGPDDEVPMASEELEPLDAGEGDEEE